VVGAVFSVLPESNATVTRMTGETPINTNSTLKNRLIEAWVMGHLLFALIK
jgi:hypothetical protein